MSIGTDGSIDGEVDRTSKSTEYRQPTSNQLSFSMGNGQRKFTAGIDGDILRITIAEGDHSHEWFYLDYEETKKLGALIATWVRPDVAERRAVETTEDYLTAYRKQAISILDAWLLTPPSESDAENLRLLQESLAMKANKPLCSCGHDGRPGPGHQMNCAQYRERAENGSEQS
jgi:hypothetical protein